MMMQPLLSGVSSARGDMTFLVAQLDAAYNLARWLVRNETEADDLVQEASLRAFSHFTGFQGRDGRARLLTIVRNGCYDRLTVVKKSFFSS